MSLIEAFLPAGLSLLGATGLVLAAFLTATLTAAMGIGGGVVMLAVMTQIVPISVLIPVHGVVQVGANVSRAVAQWRHTHWNLIGYFLAGSLVGAVVGGNIFVALPEDVILVTVALFILWSVWGSLPAIRGSGRAVLAIVGAVAAVLTMFVGASGPFVVAMFRQFNLNKTALVGTHATAMTLQHGLKVVVFGFLGFAFGEWLPIMVVMVLCTFLGTALGTLLLHRLPEEGFRLGLKIILTAVAVQILAKELWDVVA
ncbi:sulfite exporter TauE/SafE family protein [Lutibaculum baratangense]|uniref:Probable membrane transporter protein n=1 Tax=Lutibaculum baratangense AMV1 TaxID=631454 RepID=V4RDH3_9HYPH|nr:sulfite exporter TauE/SafE family protein [Lutibaculum baratangense]ESR23404.1 protein of unknown function DUF81 [Lutibaculum baratangense AMV1]